MKSNPSLPVPQQPELVYQQATPTKDYGRERAATADSTSTATPPRLLHDGLGFGDHEEDDFGNMFAGIGQKRSSRNFDHLPAAPQNNNRPHVAQSSTYSYNSQDSQEGLVRSPSPVSPDLRGREPPQMPRKPVPIHGDVSVTSPVRSYARRRSSGGKGFILQKSPSPVYDEDAELLAESAQSRYQASQARDRFDNAAVRPQNTAPSTSPERYQEASRAPNLTRPTLAEDPTLAQDFNLVAQWEQKEETAAAANPKTATKKKVMTPAQFERYRQEQEAERKRREAFKVEHSDDSSDDNYEDDDDTQRDNEAVKLRQKQEAHLAAYRQSMMKVTGEKSSPGPSSRSTVPNSSFTDLSFSASQLSLAPKSPNALGKGPADEEEDEDVPLGILAAHGFPNKNRPPTRLSNQSSNPNLRAASATGERPANGALPAFARKLPQDPYFGSSLVNESNRASFNMGGGASVHGQIPGTPPGLHPAGLVGVIVGEERARAARRGSPNASGSYEGPHQPGMSRSQTMGNMSMYGQPGMMPGQALPLTPGDQAQIQMAQQMNQMMQMQMQWMQQMTAMQQGGQSMDMQMPQAPGMTPGMLAPPEQISRPMSMPLQQNGQQTSRPNGRAMSTLSPGMANWNRPSSFSPSIHLNGSGQGYTPSIAPTERSNVGLASRYRPVSTLLTGNRPMSKRSSTFTSGTFQPPWSSSSPGPQSPGNSTIRAVGSAPPAIDRKPLSKGPIDDDDDDQGWAEMKKKADSKKSKRKLQKAQTAGSGLQDLVYGGQ